MSNIRVGILTVSDTAARDPTADTSGPTIRTILTKEGYECKDLIVVPDDEERIRETVKSHWCDAGTVDLVITTGGTGFGVRDRTPEAIASLIERPAPGLVHLLLSSSLGHTPFAALSRPVAGTIGTTLVITLPGSVKAVKENLEALLANGLLTHAVDLLRGGSGKEVHEQLAASTSSVLDGDRPTHTIHHVHDHHPHSRKHDHSHTHGHDIPKTRTAQPLSQDPSLSVHSRQRKSPYPLLSVDDALAAIVRKLEPLPPTDALVTPKLRGCILAEDIYAPSDIPVTATSNVDGYALRASTPPGIYPAITSHTNILPDDKVLYRINTGAPIPQGADAVIMVEDTRVHSTADDTSGTTDENEIETLAQVDVGENVRKPGSDVKQGDLVLKKGTLISSAGGELGTLAFVGRAMVKVYPKPVVAILSTGNELRDLHTGTPSREGVIWDTNRPSLQAALEGMGYTVVDLGIVPDELDAHLAALRTGLESADIIITTGGTSMGTTDLLKPAIEHSLMGNVHFGRVAVKPGKPTTFATIPYIGKHPERKPIFALPGNPASALVTLHVFVVPALRRLGGFSSERCHLPKVRVQIQDPMRLDPRPEYHRVTVIADGDGLKAYSTGGQRSSRVSSLAGANGLVALPALTEVGPDKFEAGTYAEALLLGEIQSKV